jgi:hypothetical protein
MAYLDCCKETPPWIPPKRGGTGCGLGRFGARKKKRCYQVCAHEVTESENNELEM